MRCVVTGGPKKLDKYTIETVWSTRNLTLMVEVEFSISHGVGSEAQCSADIGEFEGWKLIDDFGRRHPAGDHADDSCHGDTQVAQTWHASHLRGVDRDPVH